MLRFKNIFKKKTEAGTVEREIQLFKKKYKKQQQEKSRAQERRQKIRYYLARAGIDIEHKKISKIFFNIAIVINLVISAYLIYYFSVTYGITWATIVASMIVLWIFIFVVLIFALWIMFYIAVDLKIFKRKLDIEDVLPDFMQLTAANINAGMTIDRALWFAVRPRFGVLAKEIEMVAKETISGVDLKTALDRFASRYDSVILKRAISMLNEGVEAGGEIGYLLNRIAIDIQEQKGLMKEMSANVTTYVIFISFSTIVAAPLLFSLSGVLINVVHKLSSSLTSTANSALSAGIGLSFSQGGIQKNDFKLFAIASLTTTSLFSAMMISTIKKGNIKSGVKYIPIFTVVSLSIYFVAQSLAEKLISLFF